MNNREVVWFFTQFKGSQQIPVRKFTITEEHLYSHGVAIIIKCYRDNPACDSCETRSSCYTEKRDFGLKVLTIEVFNSICADNPLLVSPKERQAIRRHIEQIYSILG